MVYQIISDIFCAGIVTDKDGVITSTAPIFEEWMGWTINDVKEVCLINKWECNFVPFKEEE